MKKILFTTLLLSLFGCDAPMRNRAPGQFQNGDSLTTSSNTSTAMAPGTLNYTPPTETTTGGTTGTTTDPNFPACDTSNKYNSVDVGHFGLCQSTVTETLFKVKFSQTTSVRNCLIPLFKDASGSSTYIGQPQCTLVNSADAVMQGSLLKNRQGFESYPLNGVIVMKEPLMPEYFKCMHAYINWIPQACPNGPSTQYCAYWMPRCPYGARTNVGCDLEAKNYMSIICNNFKSKYSSYYSDIRTK